MNGVSRVGESQPRWTWSLPCLARHTITLCVWCVTDVPHCEVVACKCVAVFCDGCVPHCDAVVPHLCALF